MWKFVIYLLEVRSCVRRLLWLFGSSVSWLLFFVSDLVLSILKSVLSILGCFVIFVSVLLMICGCIVFVLVNLMVVLCLVLFVMMFIWLVLVWLMVDVI